MDEIYNGSGPEWIIFMWYDELDLVANIHIIFVYVMIWVYLKSGSEVKL